MYFRVGYKEEQTSKDDQQDEPGHIYEFENENDESQINHGTNINDLSIYSEAPNTHQNESPFENEGVTIEKNTYIVELKHCKYFLNVMVDLQEVFLPANEQKFTMNKYNSYKYEVNKIICGKKRDLNDIATYKYLSELGLNDEDFMWYYLRTAIIKNNLELIKSLIALGININYNNDYIIIDTNSNSNPKNKNKFTKKLVHAMHATELAIEYGRVEILKYLVEMGADIKGVINYKLQQYENCYDMWNCIDDYENEIDDYENEIDDYENEIDDYENEIDDYTYKCGVLEYKNLRHNLINLVTNSLNGDIKSINDLKENILSPIESIWLLRYFYENHKKYLNNNLFYQIIAFSFQNLNRNWC
jgi:hypothetical protein